MEEILKLLDGYSIFKLDNKGNVVEVAGFEEIEGSFLNVVSEEDRKKAAKLFIEASKTGKAEGVLRLKTDDVYRVFHFKFARIGEDIYGIAKEIKKEEPSFMSDFLGNVIHAREEWEEIEGRNIYDIVDEKEKLMDVIESAIEKGEYEGKIFINEKEAKIRIKATQWLEFFIEEDFYRLLEDVIDARNANELFDKVKEAMENLGIKYSLKLFDMQYGEQEEDAIHVFPIFKRGESVGEIRVYEEIDGVNYNFLKFISITASKSIESMEDICKILQDFAVYKIDEKGRILYANRKFEEITGLRIEEIVNRNIEEFAENRDEFFEKLKQGMVENFVSKWKGKDREIIAKEHARRINGEIIVIIEDITYEKEKEREAEFYNSLLRHDIFNKNEIAMGYIGLLEKTNLTKKQKTLIEKIKHVIADSNKLIENVRKAEEIRKPKGELFEVNINEVIKNICKSYEESARKKGIEIHCNIDDVVVEADEFVGEIFSNLIKNSIEHAKCKNIRIYGEREGNFYKIYFEDDGKGIDEEYKEKIFEEGWRKGGSGSGLGLYIVKKLMKRYEGKIELDGVKGKGLKFTLYFRIPTRKKKPEFLKIRF